MVSLGRIGWIRKPLIVVHRNGVRIEPPGPLKTCWGEIFEPLMADVYEFGRQKNLDIILDVGANIGAFSCLAAHTHPSARVIAFEPSAVVLPLLRRNLDRNGASNVTVVPQPLAGSRREVTFYDAGGTSSNWVLAGKNPRPMMTTTLESVDWGSARRAFIKLDCEGAEGEILQWISEHQKRLPRTLEIACEYHPWCPVPVNDSVQALQSAGFRVRLKTQFGEPYLFASRG